VPLHLDDAKQNGSTHFLPYKGGKPLKVLFEEVAVDMIRVKHSSTLLTRTE
jgi:hypothetical protein